MGTRRFKLFIFLEDTDLSRKLTRKHFGRLTSQLAAKYKYFDTVNFKHWLILSFRRHSSNRLLTINILSADGRLLLDGLGAQTFVKCTDYKKLLIFYFNFLSRQCSSDMISMCHRDTLISYYDKLCHFEIEFKPSSLSILVHIYCSY